MSTLPDNPLENGGIAVFAEELRAGRIAAKTAVKAYLDRIQALEPKLNAYQYVAYEQAEEAADAIDKLLHEVYVRHEKILSLTLSSLYLIPIVT